MGLEELIPRNERMALLQNCWVVTDLDDAMERWLSMGVGPFLRRDSDYPDALYRGRPEPLAFKAALAQAGPVQIELIQQTSKGPSAYRDMVPEGQTGFHHMCRIVHNVGEEIRRLRARGIEMASEFRSVGGAQVAYADTRNELGCMLELVPAEPVLINLFRDVAEAARYWDGRDPVRMLELKDGAAAQVGGSQ
ncbi:VOC family protein [Sphingobium sp. Cam5-1]|uniref:VOC family protein n=1 Tax=Sphingobium sp. Cam5-1 TaxID=2789327 RepID=UPI0018AD132A|nr:VOC family protein [Sphingobium sp. Cam5-1]QPI74904.1 VOC family protein [Sphingobium sp. Cam5-1]